MGDKGTASAMCQTCLGIPSTWSIFGKQISKDSNVEYQCRACVLFLERKEQEQLFQKLKGPDPETILRTVADKFPWAFEIAKASPEEQLDALQFLKRKLSGHRTVQALAESLANNNAQAALLIQQLGQNLKDAKTEDTMTTRVLRSFVKNQCPVVKYKTLLLPPGGSLYKATRHFQDMLKVEDKLVVALAKERLFLLEWAEAHFRPQHSEKQKKKGEFPEVPEAALKIVRLTFKSLSNKVKNAAMRDDDANLMVKAWYAEHFDWATTWASISTAEKQALLGPTAFHNSTTNGGRAGQKRPGEESRMAQQPATKTFRPDFVQGSVGNKQVSVEKELERLLATAPREPGSEYTADMYKNHRASAQSLFAIACRNCFAAGKGLQQHSFADCKKAGNKCVLLCPKCKKDKHWIYDCPL